MKVLTRSFTIFLLLFLSIACSSALGPAKKPNSTETPVVTQASAISPTKKLPPTQTTVLLPTATMTSGSLSPVLRMNVQRAAHTATLLPDGTVLITGGFRAEGTTEISIASAEIYDPETKSFTLTNNMNEARNGHTATLLPNGQVLIVGGWGVNGPTPTAELYDPQTGKFRYAASLSVPRAGMTATLLNNGTVLIAGGESMNNTRQLIAEIYDPATNTFMESGSLNIGRSAHTATLLNDGNVLLIGGNSSRNNILSSAEIYNPTTGKFTYTGEMSMVRHKHAAVLLQDGNVLVIGGSNQDDWNGKYTSAEIYDANTGKFLQISNLNKERFKLENGAVLLDNGNVLVGGGNQQIEIYDAGNQRFILGDRLDNDYFSGVLIRLLNGSVLITGGYDTSIQPSDKAWIYQ